MILAVLCFVSAIVSSQSHEDHLCSRLQTASLMSQFVLAKSQDYCPMKYNEKCFWIEPRRFAEIQCNETTAICAAHGGKPANIYSEEHHYMLLGNLRLFTRGSIEMNAFLGMRYNTQNNEVTLRNGTRAPYVKWYPTYPMADKCCCTGMVARTDRNSEKQHFHNWSPGLTRMGVICEK